MKYICKLYNWEEYETPIGRMESINIADPVGTAAQRLYKYEKIKQYGSEMEFDSEREAYDWGQEQMYYDECLGGYDIVKKEFPK